MNLNMLRWNMMNIELVKWKTEDYQEFFILSKDKEIWANMSDDFPHTLEECKQIVSFFSTSEDVTECIRAIKVDNRKAGCIAAFFETGMYCKNVEISYWLNGEYRGMGIMPQVIKTFTQNLFTQFDKHRVWARPFEFNKASQKALEKSGFTYEGLLKENAFKNNQYMNSMMYALIRK